MDSIQERFLNFLEFSSGDILFETVAKLIYFGATKEECTDCFVVPYRLKIKTLKANS